MTIAQDAMPPVPWSFTRKDESARKSREEVAADIDTFLASGGQIERLRAAPIAPRAPRFREGAFTRIYTCRCCDRIGGAPTVAPRPRLSRNELGVLDPVLCGACVRTCRALIDEFDALQELKSAIHTIRRNGQWIDVVRNHIEQQKR